MIHHDRKHDQFLSPLCRACPDEAFTPKHRLFHVGCCSHSPVFSLYEIHQMVRSEQTGFFIDHVYRNPASLIRPYEIKVPAEIHTEYDRQSKPADPVEREDLRRSYAVCRFFIDGEGCGLKPQTKPVLCRTFICTTIENGLDADQRTHYVETIRTIRQKVEAFNLRHQRALSRQGRNLADGMPEVLEYLEKI